MRKRSIVIVTFLATVTGVISNLPLSWIAGPIIPKNELPSLRYGGTVWDGHIAGFPGLGPISLTTSPLKMVTGKPYVTMETKSRNLSARGMAKPGHLHDIVITGNMAHIAAIDARFTGLSGDFQMNLRDMVFDKQCDSADGTVSTNVLTKNMARLQWAGPNLSGPISCENGDFIMELSGQDAMQTIDATVRLVPDGTFRADVNVLTRDERAGSVLPLFGFQPKDNGFTLRESGRWM